MQPELPPRGTALHIWKVTTGQNNFLDWAQSNTVPQTTICKDNRKQILGLRDRDIL